jgi:hypothetical protein
VIDMNTAIIETVNVLQKENNRLRETLRYIAGFPVAAQGQATDYILGLELAARYATAALEKEPTT